jgi:hypothetical protein
MAYFNELPNLEIVNRTSNVVSNDETLIVKNLFKRGKLREDISNVVTAFEYYNVEGNERPDQVAQKVYGDSELDWVIMLTNNIINVNDDWPISKDSFDNYLLSKYGSEEELYKVRYYETIELRDSFGRVVIPDKLIVDEAFYKAPEFAPNETPPPGITFPPITSPGTVAVATAILNANGSVVNVAIANTGKGYVTPPNIFIGDPPVTRNSSAQVAISDFTVSGIATLDGGQGYNTTPTVSIGLPSQSVQASAECEIEGGEVRVITNLIGGLGYGNTAPTVEFESPRSLLSVSFVNETFNSIGDQIDGMYVREDGLKLYTSNGIGTSLIQEYDLTESWNSTTISFNKGLDLTSDFSYCNGIEFKPDGTRMFVSGGKSGEFKLISYDLTIAWDISTATKVHEILTTNPGGVRFNDTGTRLYFLDSETADKIEEYILTTPWNISTKGTVVSQLNVQSVTGDSQIIGFTFFENGRVLFVCGEGDGYVYQLNLSINWDITTAVLVDKFFVGNKLSNPSDVFVRPNKKTLFLCGGTSDKLFEYSMFSVAEGESTLDSNGSVNSIVIVNPGVGYTVAPQITLSSPYPSIPATAVANLTNGIVTSITITNSGFGYTMTPNLTIQSAPISRKARLTVTSIQNSGISSVVILDQGLNYQTTPVISFSNPGEVTEINIGDIYNQSERTWKWNGSEWEEKITQEFGYLDPINSIIIRVAGNKISRPISNYEYEVDLNEQKRLIRILKPEYLSVVISDLRNIMTYDSDTQGFVNEKLKRTYNPKFTGV